jgi:hypothetical protein
MMCFCFLKLVFYENNTLILACLAYDKQQFLDLICFP